MYLVLNPILKMCVFGRVPLYDIFIKLPHSSNVSVDISSIRHTFQVSFLFVSIFLHCMLFLCAQNEKVEVWLTFPVLELGPTTAVACWMLQCVVMLVASIFEWLFVKIWRSGTISFDLRLLLCVFANTYCLKYSACSVDLCIICLKKLQ